MSKSNFKTNNESSQNSMKKFKPSQEECLQPQKMNWKRPIDDNYLKKIKNGKYRFQMIDIDLYNTGSGSVVRLYGVDKKGHSVLAYVHNFETYLYIDIPTFMLDKTDEFSEKIKQFLHTSLKTNFVCRTFVVEKSSILGYNFNKKSKFLKITFNYFHLVNAAKRIFEKQNELGFNLSTYESTLPHELRFMIDTNIIGNCWLELTDFTVRSYSQMLSHCSIEIDVQNHKSIIAHNELTSKWMRIAPFRILSFDIECACRKGHFPEASQDKVIQIANQVTLQGQAEPIIKNIFVLRSCSPIVGVDVRCFDDERSMLRSWAEFVIESDADIFTGYNIINFDIPYLLNRAEALGIEDFGFLGRIANSKVRIRNSYYSNQAYGRHETKTISLEGRVIFDLLPIVQKEYKLHSYTLNAVSAHFLQQQKEDVHFSIISELFEGTAETRRRLAVYCVKDAVLPQRLMDRLMIVVNMVEMSRVTGVPLSYLLTRGQQIKVISQLYRKAMTKDIIVPYVPVGATDSQYTGATVLDPKTGYYKDAIATLDFNSLYPSIMIAHNLCYTTLISKTDALAQLDKDDYSITPNGDVFVKPHLQKGLLPEVLAELLSARKKAKADLAKETDPYIKSVLNGRQLALKISANSVYGFTGASVGSLPCIPISSSVTAYGREMILSTKKKIEEEFVISNGYAKNATVIYGDTDSVMINFGYEDAEKTIDLGKKASQIVTSMFLKPINLEFEKIYKPYLLMAKKRYAGMVWTSSEKSSFMDAKGIETVRRDNCALARDLVQNCLNKLLIDQDVEGAVAFAKNVIKKLLTNKIDLSKLVITKMLGKAADSSGYKVKLPHVELAKRMALRDSGSAPMVGDRVSYVIVEGRKGARQYEKAEDPIYVLEKSLPIDTKHYLEHQLKMPLERIFSPIIGDINKLLLGEHTRNIKITSSSKSPLMKFFSTSSKCKGCKTVLNKNQKAVCEYCEPNIRDIYLNELNRLWTRERMFSELWVQCQRCQECLTQEIICSNRDCPIFYRRTKAAKDLDEAVKSIREFEI